VLLVCCQTIGKESQKTGVERKEKERTHARKSNECMLLTEIPGAMLMGSDGEKLCSFR